MSTSGWIVFCVAAILCLLFLITSTFFIIRHYIHYSLFKKNRDIIGFFLGTFGVLFSVILGFTLVNSQQNYLNLVTKINEEAYLTEQLFQAAHGFSPSFKIKLQKNIMIYLESVFKEEWPLMAKKQENPITLKKLENMLSLYYNYKPQNDVEKIWFAKSIDVLLKHSSARLERIYSSWQKLGSLIWTNLILGTIILILFFLFIGAENPKILIFWISLFAGFFIFTLFVINAFDHPFSAPIKIKPKAYKIIYNYDTKTRNTMTSPEAIP